MFSLDALISVRYLALASGIFLGASLMLYQKANSNSDAIDRNANAEGSQRKKKWFWYITFGLLALVVVGEPLLRSWLQYEAWSGNPQSKFLLPPHQPISYFLGYSMRHFFIWRWVAFGIAAVLYLLADRFIVRPSRGFKLNRNENFLIAFGVALAGWPYLLVYLVVLLLLYAVMLAGFMAFSRSASVRFPIVLPATVALLIIPFGPAIIAALGLNVLRVTGLSV